MLIVDGVEWNIPCKITRKAELTSSDISGMLLNKDYFNDVLGTWMKYEVELEIPYYKEQDYYSIYEVLSAPRDGHSFVLPYNGSQITLTARVEVISDVYVNKPNGRGKWRNTRFTVIANHPTKTYQAEEVIAFGLTPRPEAPSANPGDLYEFTDNGWIERYYVDADTIGY